ncbi:MAG: family 43 glycosylhydrolase [Clostridia bacterium]|nr:family 43 glycosylhydrolase [Clostridia bacterium]
MLNAPHPDERLHNPLAPVGRPDNRFPDPHIKIFVNPDTGNEAMYVYVGHDEAKERFVMKDWFVLWSEDLVHWNWRRSLRREDTYLPDDSENCWACDCVQSPWDGKYYLYYSNAGDDTGVAVSDRPDGPFVDARGKTPILPKGITPTNSYDPDIILPDEDDPNAYILFGSDWTDHYWAMQLKENMVEVVPGSGRKVPVYPADGTPTELLGVLRSDQAEVFRRGDTWYMYWAGRYSTSKNRLGPYVFHSDLGKEIPHYPDGRCFIDHGSFVEWKGQWFYAVSHGTESWSYRQSWLLYLHFCDDGTMMIDETIRRCGVGSYFAGWDRIEAEWYMAIPEGVKKIELKNPDGSHEGFAIAQEEGIHDVAFPHVYNIAANSMMKLHAKGSGTIEVLADGKSLGTAAVDAADFTDVCVDLGSLAGEHDITLRMTGRIALDWFTLK